MLAFEVGPLVHRLESIGHLTTAVVVVNNTTGQPLPVEFSPYEMQLLDNQIARGAAADDDILVFPPSALIAPGAQQAVRMQWLGDPELESARSYLVQVEQIPLPDSRRRDSNQADSGVQLLLTFNVVVHVSPPRAAPALQMLAHRLIPDTSPAEMELTVRNTGNGHAFGSVMSLVVGSPQGDSRFPLRLAQDDAAELFFPPDYQRRFRVVLPDRKWREPLAVQILHEPP